MYQKDQSRYNDFVGQARWKQLFSIMHVISTCFWLYFNCAPYVKSKFLYNCLIIVLQITLTELLFQFA